MEKNVSARAKQRNKKTLCKRIIFCIFLCVLLAAIYLTAIYSCAIFDERIEGVDYGEYIDYAKTYASAPISGDLTNLVIFICFSDEDVEDIRVSLTSSLIGYFNGGNNSLKDYYYRESYGNISVNSLFAIDEVNYYIYQDSNTRAHYKGVKKKTAAATRYREESALLNAAINAANEYFDYTGKNLDVNADGYVDSVSFIVSKGYDSTDDSAWGGLLWPHSWELEVITSRAGGTLAKLNGIKVNRYSFNFMTSVNTGLLCHETGHVLGMPDLYHYDYDTNYVQVGKWDLMHLNTDTPQYSLTYMRQKYLNVVGDNQIVDLEKDGTYTLKPTTIATAEDVLAYRLILNETESLYMEYRNNSVSTYDSMLPGSGLIIYRINGSAEGNTAGKNHNTYYPDEVFIYRPSVNTGSVTKQKELANLSYAFLSPDNNHFTSLGNATSSAKYATNAIYLTNGVNTGIVVTADSLDDDKMTFSVRLNGYGKSEVSDIYVEGKPEINYGENLNVTVKIKMKGYSTYVTADPTKYRLIYDATTVGTQTAMVIYGEGEEEISCNFTLKIKDKVETNGVAKATDPSKLTYRAGESIDLMGLSITVRYVSGAVVSIAYTDDTVSLWEAEGADMNVSGDYNVKVTYKPFDVYVYCTIVVTSELSNISISEKNTLTIFDVDENYALTVEGRSIDGRVRTLDMEDIELSVLFKSPIDLYKEQTLTVTEKSTGLTATKKVVAVDYDDLTDVAVTLPKTVYRYGEALDLTQGAITFSFGENRYTVPLNNYYDLVDECYSPKKRGTQTLGVAINGLERIRFDVTVLPPDNAMLASIDNGVAVDVNSGYAVFNNPTTLTKAEKCFTSYLDIRFVYTDGSLTYDINSVTYDLYMDRNVGIELVNENGTVISKFRVFVYGDGNNDGLIDASDVDYWAASIFHPTAGSDIYLDANGDGKYDLTDFSILVSRYGGNNG